MMGEQDFQELIESIREAKRILQGEKKASREFVIETPAADSAPAVGYAICVQTDDPSLLMPRKIYETTYSQAGSVRVIDEAGESALYPEDFFLPVALPKEVEQVLALMGKDAR